MRAMIRTMPIAALILLAGCGARADSPENIPKIGKWQKDVKLVALIANDVWIDRKDAPLDLPPDRNEVIPCIEPALQTKNKINNNFLANTEKLCTVDSLESSDGAIVGKGTCGPASRFGGTMSGTMEFDGREREDRIDATLSLNVNLKQSSGATERIRVGVEMKWKRLGDCA
jgi:hypothetical protein